MKTTTRPGYTDMIVSRTVHALVVSALLLMLGLFSLDKLPIRQYPELSNTTITIVTTYPGANADLIQGFITVPIQQAVASAEGIDTLTACPSWSTTVRLLSRSLI